jgi:hypothetical protein
MSPSIGVVAPDCHSTRQTGVVTLMVAWYVDITPPLGAPLPSGSAVKHLQSHRYWVHLDVYVVAVAGLIGCVQVSVHANGCVAVDVLVCMCNCLQLDAGVCNWTRMYEWVCTLDAAMDLPTDVGVREKDIGEAYWLSDAISSQWYGWHHRIT